MKYFLSNEYKILLLNTLNYNYIININIVVVWNPVWDEERSGSPDLGEIWEETEVFLQKKKSTSSLWKRGSTGRQQRRRKEEWKNKVRRSSFRLTTAGTQHAIRKSCFTTDDEVRGAPGCGCHRSSLYSHTEVSYVYETDVRNEREVLKRVKSNT